MIDINSMEAQVNYNGEDDFEHFRLNNFDDMVRAVRDLDIESLAHGFPGFEKQKDSFHLLCKPFYTIKKTEKKHTVNLRNARTDEILASYEIDTWEICKKDAEGNPVVLREGSESALVRAFYHMMLVLEEGVRNYVSDMRQNRND